MRVQRQRAKGGRGAGFGGGGGGLTHPPSNFFKISCFTKYQPCGYFVCLIRPTSFPGLFQFKGKSPGNEVVIRPDNSGLIGASWHSLYL